jgi:predicted urease superfamily metal-dependent hydrolase
MPDNSNYKIATADALTLLLHNQHALGAAIEEITKWLSENGVENVAAHAMSAMKTLDANAQAITESIMRNHKRHNPIAQVSVSTTQRLRL